MKDKTECGTLVVAPSIPRGTIRVSGAKNSALRLLVASILTEQPVSLRRFPADSLDVQTQLQMLQQMGKSIDVSEDAVEVSEISEPSSDFSWRGRSIRNSLLLLGSLLARTGEARVPRPGGCQIGVRPYDLHVEMFRAFGVEVWEESGSICAKMTSTARGPLSYESPIRSTGVTENAILFGATYSPGITLINPHLSPEVLDLIEIVEQMGSVVLIDGQRSITVSGDQPLGAASMSVIPDRDEAVTWAAAAVIGHGDVEIAGAPIRVMTVALEYLRSAGARIFRDDTNSDMVIRSAGPQPLTLSVDSHPGVHSDMNPLFAAIAASAFGRSDIIDLRYPERFKYLDEFSALGTLCEVSFGRATIHGRGRLRGGTVTAPDLRAGAALMVAALAADSPVEIRDAWQITRGYSRLVEKLSNLQVDFEWKV